MVTVVPSVLQGQQHVQPSVDYFEISKNIEVFTTLYKELNTYYVDPIDPGKLMKIGIEAMLSSLDPYTNFYSESQIEGSRFLMEGNYDGLGAEIKHIDGFITITEIYEKGPAAKAGLKVGDKIVEVKGENLSERNLEEFKAIMRGTPGTEAQLSVVRPGLSDPLSVTLIRGETSIENVPYYGMVSDEVGYISLVTFTKEAGRNVSNALKALRRDNPQMKSVILDLRNNGGGLLHEAVNLSNIFIPNGQLVASTKGKIPEWDNYFRTKMEPVDLEIPVAVLINKMSASASEIVSGVIQDYDRGVVIGQRSYGKGLVQNTKSLGFNNQFKLTTSKYYIPSGRCIQSVEYENGEPKDIPDDKRAVFYTKNGRKVLDGGGVTPDIILDAKEDIPFVKALIDANIIFHYVTDYIVEKNPDITDPKTYTFTDFADFKKYVEIRKKDILLPIEAKLQALTEEAQNTQFSGDLSRQITSLQKAVEKEKSQSLDRYRAELENLIGEQIVLRLKLQSGRVMYKLANDSEINKAIEVLGNQDLYRSILQK